MRATLSRLRERVNLFAQHMVHQSFGVSDEGSSLYGAQLERRSVALVEALIDWLCVEEGHPDEWRLYAQWVGQLDELSGVLGEQLISVGSLTRMLLNLEGHLLSFGDSERHTGGDWLAWRRRYLSACERLISLCELRDLFRAAREPEWRSPALELLSSLAFGEEVRALHEPLSAQLEARFNVDTALSSRHLFTLESAAPSWWRLSLSQLCQHQQLELIPLTVRPGAGWEPLQALARHLLKLCTSDGAHLPPERALLRCWAEPLSPRSQALEWLEELSPRSRLTWLRRALQSTLYELVVERAVRVCVWIESADQLSVRVAQELVRLLSPQPGSREAPLILIAHHRSAGELPEAFTALDSPLRSTLPQQRLFEWAQLTWSEEPLASWARHAEGDVDLAREWEALWLLSLTGQVSLNEQGGLQGSLSKVALRFRALTPLVEALWRAMYLQLNTKAQRALLLRRWRGLLSDQLTGDDSALSPWLRWFGGVPGQGVSGLWAPLERPTVWRAMQESGTLTERVERLDIHSKAALRRVIASAVTDGAVERVSVAEACRFRAALGEGCEAQHAWAQLTESTLSWWGLKQSESPEALACSLLDQQDLLCRASEALTLGSFERSEELLAMALSRGERGGGYWRAVRVTFGLLCWCRGTRDEASLFIDEVLSKPRDERWGARLQARALLLKGINAREEGALREASLYLYTALHVTRSIGELSLQPTACAELARLALGAGDRAAGLLLLEECYVASHEQGLGALMRRVGVECGLWALHYGDLQRAQRFLAKAAGDLLAPQALIERLSRFALGLHATNERAWGEALSLFAQLTDDEHLPASEDPISRAQGRLSLEARLYLGLSLLESDSSVATLVRAQGLARDVRLHREVDASLALFARYLELRVISAQPLAGDAKARELRSRLYELREEWGERCALGALTLSEALLYTLCGVEVGATTGSVMEQVTELELIRSYVTRARGELRALRWGDHLEQRWELQRIKALLPERGAEVPWMGLS